MELSFLKNTEISRNTVIIRADLDVDLEQSASNKLQRENLRLKALIPTIKYVHKRDSKIILIGHRGRPVKENRESLSLRDLAPVLSDLIGKEVKFIESEDPTKIKITMEQFSNLAIILLENLRFNPGEEENSEAYAKQLLELADVYVNEAFSVSHRKHMSVNALPLQFKRKGKPVCLGLRFESEIENLSKIFDDPKRPVVALISGVKKDKLDYIEPFSKFADKILISGRLPGYLGDDRVSVRLAKPEDKVVSADLIQDKEDITIHSMEVFEEIIKDAGTVVVSGPVGKFEDEGHRQGTQRVFKAVADSSAFKVAGGGDTQEAISLLGLTDKFDWISVGGGAMLEFLANGTLPGIEVLKS